MAFTGLLPHCSVCKRTLELGCKQPYLLPCLHSVCAKCFDRNKKSVSCSSCRVSFSKQDHIFLKDTVTQANIFDATVTAKPSEIKCTNKPRNNVATILCQECQILFCKPCQASHSQVKNSHPHELILVRDLPRKGTPAGKSYCPEHESYVLDLYDVTCRILICFKCGREEHKNCGTEELDAAWNEEKDVLQKGNKNLQQKLQDTIKTLEEVNIQHMEMKKRHTTMKEALGKKFEYLRNLVTKREEELLKELEVRQNTEINNIQTLNNQLDMAAEKLQVAQEYTEKLLGQNSPRDFLTLNETVKSRIDVCLGEEVEDVVTARVTLEFSKGMVDELKVKVASIGAVIATEEKDCFLNDYVNVGQLLDTQEQGREKDTDISSSQQDDLMYINVLDPTPCLQPISLKNETTPTAYMSTAPLASSQVLNN